jgi:hypothetical protein
MEQKNEYFLEEVRDAEIWSEPGGFDCSSERSGKNPGLLFRRIARRF